jgi:RimJ/RimL family protein N-acetyltransferase
VTAGTDIRDTATMLSQHWPLTDLRVRTPRLELFLPSPEQLADLADLAAEGIHDPAFMPFLQPWTDESPEQRARGTIQYHWRQWAAWTPQRWSLELVVARDGVVVGTQSVGGNDFGVLREVGTGSWLGRKYHGEGIGTEMRAAVLHLAFAGLGAQWAYSGAFVDNAASLAVSRKLGYVENGYSRHVRRGEPVDEVGFRMSRADWESHRRTPVEIDGLEPCLPMFGLGGAEETAR